MGGEGCNSQIIDSKNFAKGKAVAMAGDTQTYMYPAHMAWNEVAQ